MAEMESSAFMTYLLFNLAVILLIIHILWDTFIEEDYVESRLGFARPTLVIVSISFTSWIYCCFMDSTAYFHLTSGTCSSRKFI